MGLFNNFPYPDTHQLNLDWILDKVKELWKYVKEPGDGIQKALLDAKAAAITAEASAKNAQQSASYAQQYVDQVQTYSLNAQTSANNAQQSASNAREDADLCRRYLNDMKYMWGKLYPVGAIYYNTMTKPESDATVIARLQALTGGTWAMDSIYGDPVQDTENRGWITFTLKNAANNSATFNGNIYVRTA